MAVDDPPPRRLFDRRDFAPRPVQALFSELLARRGGENDFVLERSSPRLASALQSAETRDAPASWNATPR
jgi:hypothetical protein